MRLLNNKNLLCYQFNSWLASCTAYVGRLSRIIFSLALQLAMLTSFADVSFYIHILVITGIISAVLIYKGHSSNLTSAKPAKPGYSEFKRKYLTVYAMVMASDWLMGAYGYSLYKSYGFSMETIAYLFVIGFMSSAVFGNNILITGTIAGWMVDQMFYIIFELIGVGN